MIREELIKLLPPNIYETEELGENAKKVLGALLERVENSKAGETGIVYCNMEDLAKIAGIRKERLYDARTELKLYNLLSFKTGTGRGNATEYYINWDALEKPLKKKSISERYGRFMKGANTSENPVGTTVQYNSEHNNPEQHTQSMSRALHLSSDAMHFNTNSLHNNSEENKPVEDNDLNNSLKDDMPALGDAGIKKEEDFEKEKEEMFQHWHVLTQGKSSNEITKQLIPMSNWINMNFSSDHAKRLQNVFKSRNTYANTLRKNLVS